ncbi:hypothetical protein V7S43_005185 [Phytophthora oleae]|uniref:Uncharacterized protein n=1 Tax=Phytophthora oleae TaxID=2107226 RepID=A0ABD3FSV9_9STRA
MSPGIFSLDGRTETSEGHDIKMATHYYGRFMLTHDLLGEVRVLNVLGGGQGGYLDVEDLDLKHTYSLRLRMQYSDLMAQAFSEHAPNASFLQCFSWIREYRSGQQRAMVRASTVQGVCLGIRSDTRDVCQAHGVGSA